jgi:hypothetical protein
MQGIVNWFGSKRCHVHSHSMSIIFSHASHPPTSQVHTTNLREHCSDHLHVEFLVLNTTDFNARVVTRWSRKVEENGSGYTITVSGSW